MIPTRVEDVESTPAAMVVGDKRAKTSSTCAHVLAMTSRSCSASPCIGHHLHLLSCTDDVGRGNKSSEWVSTVPRKLQTARLNCNEPTQAAW